MDHDYAHCGDYNRHCPNDCFRAKITSEAIAKRLTISWMHFKGDESEAECREYERQKQGEVTE